MNTYEVIMMQTKKYILIILSTILFSDSARALELVYSGAEESLAQTCAAIVTEVHQRIGMRMQVKWLPAKRALMMSNSGKTDGEICRIKEIVKDYPNLIRVEPSIYVVESHVFSNNIELQIKGWHSLKPYRIGIRRGHHYAINGTKGMEVIQTDTDKQLISILEKEIIDLAVMLTVDALKVIQEQNLEKNIKMLQPAIQSLPLYFYLHKKNAHLVSKISDALQQLTDEGRIEAIINFRPSR